MDHAAIVSPAHVLELFKAVGALPGRVSVAEVCALTDLPPAVVAAGLGALVDEGLLLYDQHSATYAMSLALWRMAQRAGGADDARAEGPHSSLAR